MTMPINTTAKLSSCFRLWTSTFGVRVDIVICLRLRCLISLYIWKEYKTLNYERIPKQFLNLISNYLVHYRCMKSMNYLIFNEKSCEINCLTMANIFAQKNSKNVCFHFYTGWLLLERKWHPVIPITIWRLLIIFCISDLLDI